MEEHGLQCGFCTPGHDADRPRAARPQPGPDRTTEIREAISGQICRCTGYANIVEAIRWAAEHEAAPASVEDEDRRMATTEDTTATERPIGFGRMQRKEDPRFVRGQGNYVDDVELPGMLHGAVLRSPLAHARIVSIDTTAALAAPEGARRHHRQGPGGPEPGLDADAVGRRRRPCWPPTRCASRARRSRSSSPTTATPPATRSS